MVTARHNQGKFSVFDRQYCRVFYMLLRMIQPVLFEIGEECKKELRPIVEVLAFRRKGSMEFTLQFWALKAA